MYNRFSRRLVEEAAQSAHGNTYLLRFYDLEKSVSKGGQTRFMANFWSGKDVHELLGKSCGPFMKGRRVK